mmetsp:Transcript_30669/g.71662  ORF Transcript_30669/g.71662 Transcript_30669/m.71662 type:complete len:374 (+) Transcript_30669:3-1124(+)
MSGANLHHSMTSLNTGGNSFTTGEPHQGLAGIGLLMQQDGGPSTKVFIKNVVPGGACGRDGVVQVGDFVVGVNGNNVVGLPVAEIRECIVGPIGSQIRVSFERQNGEVYERTLTRGSAVASEDPYHSMSRSIGDQRLSTSASAIPTAADGDVLRLRGRVHELESELTICRDELGRARNLLDQDKDNSARYVRELDMVHRKHQDQVAELRHMLNQSEQARRELEIQNQSLEGKAQMVQESFQRAKEQTEAREQYFADLKRKFEDVQLNFEKDIAIERDGKAEVTRQLQNAEAAMSRQKAEMDQFKEQERIRREKEEGVRKLLHESEAKLIAAKETEEKVSAASKQLHLLFGQWQKDFFINKSKEEAELEQYFLA